MESNDQMGFQLDDRQLHHDANFCLQAGFPMPHESAEAPLCVQQESEMNVDRQQADLVVGIVQDVAKSMVENGGGLDISDAVTKQCILPSESEYGSYIGHEHSDNAEAADGRSSTEACSDAVANVQDNTTLTNVTTDKVAGNSSSFNKVANRIDYGESVAMEDFGGEFDDEHGIEQSAFAVADVFADNELNNSAAVNVSIVTGSSNDTHEDDAQPIVAADVEEAEERLDLPESLDRIDSESPGAEGSATEDEPPVLEKEVITNSRNLKQKGKLSTDGTEKSSPKVRPRRSRRLSDGGSGIEECLDSEQSTSNMELNVNSRPRRSVNRKSVFEMLHVDYRYAGTPKKVSTPRGGDGEVNHESAKKQKSHKKATKSANQRTGDTGEGSTKAKHFQPISRQVIQDIDDRINTLKNRVVSYRPDDFLDDDDVEPDATNNKQEKEINGSKENDRNVLRESIFSDADDRAARSFLTTFTSESAEALSSSSQQAAEGSRDLDMLIVENQDLRSRIKELEQSKSLVRKFNIDFHGRKFSRIRSPAVSLPDQQKSEEKIVEITPATEHKAPVETSESMLSRMAVLDRREHKLREVSMELDERATSVRIAEGALRRRERKLVDFEKTLEHRERVLSRHEQNILKRELELGSPSVALSDVAAEGASEDRQSFAVEIQRRLEQRRLELDRRQALLESERARLQARERELDQLEVSSRSAKYLADESSRSEDENEDGESDNQDLTDNRTPKRSPSVKKQSPSVGKQKRKTSVSQSIRSKYLSPKKQKVSVTGTPKSASSKKGASTPSSTKKAYVLRNR